MRAPIRRRKAPAGSYQMPDGTGARWAGLELLRREPLGRIGRDEVYPCFEASIRDWLEHVTFDEFYLMLQIVPLGIRSSKME